MGKRKAATAPKEQTPYSSFVKESWEKTDKKGDYDEFTETCNIKWSEMSAKEKAPYNSTPSVPEKKQRTSKKAPNKELKKKKRPRGAYIIFCADVRGEVKKDNPDFTIIDISKELGKRWNSLPSDEKQKYQQLASEEKKRFQQESNGDEAGSD